MFIVFTKDSVVSPPSLDLCSHYSHMERLNRHWTHPEVHTWHEGKEVLRHASAITYSLQRPHFHVQESCCSADFIFNLLYVSFLSPPLHLHLWGTVSLLSQHRFIGLWSLWGVRSEVKLVNLSLWGKCPFKTVYCETHDDLWHILFMSSVYNRWLLFNFTQD